MMLYEIQRYKFGQGIIRVWVATTTHRDDFQRHAAGLDHAWSRKQHAPPCPAPPPPPTTTQTDDFQTWRNGDKRTCPQCGDVLPGDAHPNRRYCSAQCKQVARLARER